MTRRITAPVAILLLLAVAACSSGPRVGREALERLEFRPLEFEPPVPEQFELSNGVTVFFLKDPTLPLVNLFVDLRAGYLYLDREWYGAAKGLLPLMRSGGTRSLPSDSVDEVIEFHALGTSTSTSGGRLVLGVTALRRQLDLATRLWGDMLLHPRFDSAAVERWRTLELEAVRRVDQFPGTLAVQEFNRLAYGDHPIGWRLRPADLSPTRVSPARLQALHRRLICPERAVIGAAGAVEREVLRAALERALQGWERCGNELTPPPDPVLEPDPLVYLVPRPLTQSTIVMGHPGGVRVAATEGYYASRLANWLIGGSGFSSILMTRLRTGEGLAYSAASVWGASRDHERIFGVITHTRGEATVETVEAIRDILQDVRETPPDPAAVERAREAMVNGFVFSFSDPAQVVARQVGYHATGFPPDWLQRYLEGVRGIDAGEVARVIREHVHPSRLRVLIIGDTTLFDPSRLGPVRVLELPTSESGDPIPAGAGLPEVDPQD